MAVVLGLCLLPLAALALDLAARGPGGLTGALASPRTWVLLAKSLGLTVAATLVAGLIGVPMGLLLGRTDILGRGPALLLHGFSLALPPVLSAIGWFHLVSRHGPLASRWATGVLFSPVGLVLVLGTCLAPAVTLLTWLGLLGLDPTLEEAARMVAGPGRVISRILLPLAGKAVGLGALVVFSLGLSELGVPMFLRVDTYLSVVFTRLGGLGYAPGEAFGLVLPVVGVGLGLLAMEDHLVGARSFESIRASGARPPLPLGPWRWPATLAVWAVVVLGVAPILALAWAAGPAGLAAAWSQARGEMLRSLWVSAAGATVVLGVGLVAGHGLGRGRQWARWLDRVAVMAFFTPSAALAVGIVAVWNHGRTAWVYSSAGILVIGLAGKYMAAGIRAAGAITSQSPRVYEDAAALFGATWPRRFVRVFLPMNLGPILAAWWLAAILCLRDLDTVVVSYPPGGQTLPIRIFTMEANAPRHLVAGLAVLQVGLTAAALAAGMVSVAITRMARRHRGGDQ